MKSSLLWAGIFAALVCSCATRHVRDEDLQAWVGHPVVELERHPVFATLPLVRTQTSDGAEIRNYLNARTAISCSGGGAVFGGVISSTSYNTFTNCMQQVPACNNLFYVKNGIVVQYTPIGTGGAHCYTDEKLRPGFAGPADIL
ncbi:MAG TPA: hypothetical protein VKT99_16760 [Xanthobacteraceae bacterium]|jgi:hypothetical protein|nr:hypothetical protein [Xanthobacteraceae bacterium]